MTAAQGRRAGAALVVALLAAGCTGGEVTPPPSDPPSAAAGATASPEPTSSGAADAENAPRVVETTLLGDPVSLEVGPLVVQGDVAVLRLATVTSSTTFLMTAMAESFEGASPGPTGVRLLDRGAGTVLVPARTATGAPATTSNTSPGGPATDAAVRAVGEGASVVYGIYAVPTGDTVDVVLTEGGTVAGIPVVDVADASEWTVPLEEISEPVADARALPLERWVELLDGEVRTRDTPEQVALDLASDVLFASDSDALGPDAEGALAALAAQVTAAGDGAGGALTVVGHTDDVADDPYNLDLSRRRAAAVASRLGQLVDLSSWTVTVDGRGEAEPLVPGTDPASRALNRRVQVLLARPAAAAEDTAATVDTAAPIVDDGTPLPPPAGPTATGDEGVDIVDSGIPVQVRLPEVRRLGGMLVGDLEVTNEGTTYLTATAFGLGASDARGANDTTLIWAATNVTLPVGSTRVYPLDYVGRPEPLRREPMADRTITGVGPGDTRIVSVVWPDTGQDTVVVEVAPHQVDSYLGLVPPPPAPFRLTDVPVVEG
ncbi:OmpA family protein [Cellulomonas endophytica]|uniref:OmpA family protein n=1 Tax=Cellulomonas endophytica TaxID=2494735 RepID=UPI00101257F0|nr:OmpA family protein [Cellulomonas endophytica]